MALKLHGYFRSSAAYRVRIALNLKGLEYEPVSVNLRQQEHQAPAYAELNPQQLVPALEDGGNVLTQSLAIIEYLEEQHPQPALLPSDAVQRARVRALALVVACEIHPLNNLRPQIYITENLAATEEQKLAWYHHWVETGFEAIEAQLAGSPMTGRFCHEDQPGLADVCLVPQVFNARRFDVDLAAYPTIVRIDEACQALDAFDRARPENQPDAS